MSSTSSNNNRSQLEGLKEELNEKRGEIDRCTTLRERMVLANQRKPLLDKIEQYELLIESDRVAMAVHQFEEAHPPVTEECPLCHKSIRMGATERPMLSSRGEVYGVSPCCASIMCTDCIEARIEVDGEDRDRTCPLCNEAFPPYGSEEYKQQLLKHAEEGHAESQYHVGMCLLNAYGSDATGFGGGRSILRYGFDVDQGEGLKWIQIAAEQMHPKALFTLGNSHLRGIDGVLEKSATKALPLFEQAAKLGVSAAHDTLAGMYISPEGGKDDSKCTYHATIAYGLGDDQYPSLRLGMMFWGGVGGLERNLVLAKHYLEKAANHAISGAYSTLGTTLVELNHEQYDGSIHIIGHSCIPKALYWWRKAAENGDASALNKCKSMEMMVSSICGWCLRTAIGAPRAPGIDQCPNKLQRCNQCKAAYFCGRDCQRRHWKNGHKNDCVKPDKDLSQKLQAVESLNQAIRESVPPEEYEATRQKFVEALAEAIREVGPPPP